MKNEEENKGKKIKIISTVKYKNIRKKISLSLDKRRRKSAKPMNRQKKLGRVINEKKIKEKISKTISKGKKSEKSLSKIQKNKERNKKNNRKIEDDKEEDITLENNFGNKDLYSLLGIQKNATSTEIRKAYKRLVLLCHPDKNKKDPEASSKFINISRAYKILSNEQSRRYYDETGEYDEGDEGQIDITNTLNFFRKIYSTKDIDTYENKYINSKEEEQDLIIFYNENKGDITNILECIPFSKNKDVERFTKIYERLFKKKILKKNKKYEETKDKIILLKEDLTERKEAEKTLDKLTKQIISNKQKRNFDDYLKGLANKYGKNDEYEKDNHEISEEEFQKIYKRLNKNKKKKNTKK